MGALASKKRKLEKEPAAESLIPFDVADLGLRGPEIGVERLANVTRLPSANPSAANRETMRGSNDGNAPTFSGVRCTNLPKPPRMMPRPSRSTLIATPARGDQLTRSTTASRSNRKPNSKEPWIQAPPILCKYRELCAVDLLFRRSAELDALRERPVKPADLDRPADTRAVVVGLLKVGAELEHVLTAPPDSGQSSAPRPTAGW